MTRLRPAILALLAVTAVGCGVPQERCTVSVQNLTDQPITIGFVNSSYDDGVEWQPPEQLALDPEVDASTVSWGILVAPGKSASTKHDMIAHVPIGEVAYLRIYRGHLDLLSILAISQGSPSRADVPLQAGVDHITVTTKDGALTTTNGAGAP